MMREDDEKGCREERTKMTCGMAEMLRLGQRDEARDSVKIETHPQSFPRRREQRIRAGVAG